MEETEQKQTEQQKPQEKVKISLWNMGTVNKNCVTISTGWQEVNLYFSYKTLVAVNGYVSVNDWSMTTGKLLNELQPDKTQRIPHAEVVAKAQELLASVCGVGHSSILS